MTGKSDRPPEEPPHERKRRPRSAGKNPRGEPASHLLTHLSEENLARLLEENADEPHAGLIARLLRA